MIPRATYRIQFHAGFTFADAEEIVPYLADLGISHLYASPITVARTGSTHGYDVVDPTRINPELGGEAAFRSLAAALKAAGIGMIIDIVPNHMGVAGGENAWWDDVLARGQASRFAHFFDIDWSDKLLLPFLGEPLQEALSKGVLELRRDEKGLALWAYGAHRFPLRPEDQEEGEGADIAALLERQHYRLGWWRAANDELRWRRFFTITELAGLRAEDPEVFEATHGLYLRLYEEKLIDGVRVDHVDGLADPAGYCQRLRERLPGAWIVVEKILALDEPLSPDWGVDGTSGYDFMAEAAALLHDPAGEEPLVQHWARLSGRPADFHEEELQARRDMLAWEFEGQLVACVEAFVALAASAPATASLTAGMIRRAIERMMWVFPVYRTYGTGHDAPESDRRIREMVRERALPLAAPGEGKVIDHVLGWLAGEGPGDPVLALQAVRRFQQLSAPIAAKAVEDTAFYRHGSLLSRVDVGFDPSRFAMDVDEFQARMRTRRADFPRAMLATATHDHKRGEDVRARLAVLSALPEEWIAATRRWDEINRDRAQGLAPGDIYQLYQMLVGAWPDDLSGYGERIAAWQEKALREAKLRSSWTAPDEDYEANARAFLEAVLACPIFTADMNAFVRRIAPAGEANGLVQTFLRCTAPGVPDTYQGAEFGDFSLVDPDNRRPVDYASRRRTLGTDGNGYDAAKQALIARLSRLRATHPALWDEGSWEPVQAQGARAGHILAFVRRHEAAWLFGAVALRLAAPLVGTANRVPAFQWWADSRLRLPAAVEAPERAAELFGSEPFFLAIGGG